MLGVEADEEEEEEEEDDEQEGREPSPKKRKVVVNRRGKKDKREFQQGWKKGREWLQYSESQGMWCSICYPFRQNPGVMGPKSKRNALAFPSKVFRFRNVSRHSDTNYHLIALGLSKKWQGPMATMHIQLPVEKISTGKGTFQQCAFHGTQWHCALPNAITDGVT